jgi:hypothetical protein
MSREDGRTAAGTWDRSRRDALRALATGAGAAIGASLVGEAAWAQAIAVRERAAVAGAAPGALATPAFFTAGQLRTVDVLTELVIPADERSPGARAAKVAEFIDLLLGGASDRDQAIWREGLAALDAIAGVRGGRPFADLPKDAQVALLTDISQHEDDPKGPLEELFVSLKERTLQGYYTSEIGIRQELDYQGNRFLNEFVGCTHPEHMA